MLARGLGLPAKPQLATGTLKPRGPSRLVLSWGAGTGTICPGIDQLLDDATCFVKGMWP